MIMGNEKIPIFSNKALIDREIGQKRKNLPQAKMMQPQQLTGRAQFN